MMLEQWLDRVVCMDALEFLRELPDACIDMALTSPPYDNLRSYNGHNCWQFEPIAQETYRVLKPGGVLVWVVGDATIKGNETFSSFEQAMSFKRLGFQAHDTMIWEKNAPGLYGKRYEQSFEYMFVFSKGEPATFNPLMQPVKFPGAKKKPVKRYGKGAHLQNSQRKIISKAEKLLHNVWYIPTGNHQTSKDGMIGHPAMFPEKLAERHILTWSNPGEVVLDYFMGSGTTAKMARQHGRHFIGCDLSPEYVALANRRLAQPYTLPLPGMS